MNVTLYGAASNSIDRVYFDRVEELGYALAKAGHTMVFGGSMMGLMGAAAVGMHKGNGKLIGVVPHFIQEVEPTFEGCTEVIYTETMAERKSEMERRADAFIIVPGGVGTYDEFFQILTLKVLEQHARPIILYNVNGFWDSMLAIIGTGIFKGFIPAKAVNSLVLCETTQSVLEELAKNDSRN